MGAQPRRRTVTGFDARAGHGGDEMDTWTNDECEGVIEKAVRKRDWVTLEMLAKRLQEIDAEDACWRLKGSAEESEEAACD
jgi:hypothetical protein